VRIAMLQRRLDGHRFCMDGLEQAMAVGMLITGLCQQGLGLVEQGLGIMDALGGSGALVLAGIQAAFDILQ
jgi:hypothetical protein